MQRTAVGTDAMATPAYHERASVCYRLHREAVYGKVHTDLDINRGKSAERTLRNQVRKRLGMKPLQ